MAGYNRTGRKLDFPHRHRVTYYHLSDGPHLTISDAPETYSQLRGSPFVSLYASLSPWEDLAELVAWHHITAVLGQPFTVTVSGPSGTHLFDVVVSPATPGRARVLSSFY